MFPAHKRKIKALQLDLFYAKRAIKVYQTLAFIGWIIVVLGV